MARPRKVDQENEIDEIISNAPITLENMPLHDMQDYIKYNKEVMKQNKRLKAARYLIKPCPVDLHPHERIVFERIDQPKNKLKVKLLNHMIDFEKELVPGQTYDLPVYVVNWLASKGYPVWERVKLQDKKEGQSETCRMSHKTPRFALRSVRAA